MKKIIKDIFIILNRREKQKLWQLAIEDVLISILDIAFLVVLLYVINFYTQPASVVSGKKFSLAIFSQHPLLLISFFFLLFAIKNVFGFIVSKNEYNFVYGVASRIAKDNLSQYLNGSYQEYIHIDSSVINRKISQQPIEFCHYILNGIQQAFNQVILIIITLIAVIIFNPLLFPLLLLILVPPIFLITYLMKKRLDATRALGKKTSEKSIQHLQEALTGFVEGNTYGKKDFFVNRYARFQEQLNHYLSERLIIQNMPPRLIEVFAVFGLFALIVINSFAAHDYSIQFVTIGALMVAAYKIIPGIVKIINISSQIKTYLYTTEGLAIAANAAAENKIPVAPLDKIVFENIYFNYKDKDLLRGFSLSINRGDLVGVTGKSGIGKTSLVNLLLGFLTPAAGSIFINGNLSDEGARQQFWPKIAYAKQQHFFLHAPVVENIVLNDGIYDENKLKRVIAVTGLDTIIASLPMGLQTIITENGKNFSGGQRQRIVFARALYSDFDLLILDEPFNELDETSEMEMLKQLQTIAAENKMILLITHNIGALSFCNKKILLDE